MAIGVPMAHCPECQTEITEDFGLITCSGCGASLFVDMDGQVISQKDLPSEASQASAQAEVYTNDPVEGFESPSEAFEDPSENFEAEEMIEEYSEPVPVNEAFPDPSQAEVVGDPSAAEYQEPEFEEGESLGDADSAVYDPSPQYGSDVEQEPSVMGELSFDDEFEEAAETVDPIAPPVYEPEPASSDMNDVVDFANSDLSQGRDGGLRYNLKLSGIDTMDLRYAVKEALTDKRFIWDLEAMIRGIQDGVLTIEQISAVKAFVVVSRVAHLPIQISWTQHALSEP